MIIKKDYYLKATVEGKNGFIGYPENRILATTPKEAMGLFRAMIKHLYPNENVLDIVMISCFSFE